MNTSTVYVERHPRPEVSFGTKTDSYLEVTADDILQLSPDEYDGDYFSIPAVHEQVYDTAHRTMAHDFTVRKIPTHESPNDWGTTFTIG